MHVNGFILAYEISMNFKRHIFSTNIPINTTSSFQICLQVAILLGGLRVKNVNSLGFSWKCFEFPIQYSSIHFIFKEEGEKDLYKNNCIAVYTSFNPPTTTVFATRLYKLLITQTNLILLYFLHGVSKNCHYCFCCVLCTHQICNSPNYVNITMVFKDNFSFFLQVQMFIFSHPYHESLNCFQFRWWT